VSLLTQLFYALVFITRYTDLFQESWPWNYFFKVFYLLSSFYTIAIMRYVYPRTREREVAWKMSAALLAGSLVLSPFVMLIFESSEKWGFQEVQLSIAFPLPLSTHNANHTTRPVSGS
jgi:branched-subunit amino acid ABC-type transport system permease component